MNPEQFENLFNRIIQKYPCFNFEPFEPANNGNERVSVHKLFSQYGKPPFAEYEVKVSKASEIVKLTYLSKAAKDSEGFKKSIYAKYDGKGAISLVGSQFPTVRIKLSEPISLSLSDTEIEKKLVETLESAKNFNDNYKDTFLEHLQNWEEKGTL